MRLARLVAAGLVVGVVAGFVAALLRSRPRDGLYYGGATDPLPAHQPPAAPEPEPQAVAGTRPPVIDVRTPRRTVHG